MKITPRVIKGFVELDGVEKECVKEYLTKYYRKNKYDTLQEYLDFIDNTESFEICRVRSNGKYVDGISIPGREYSTRCHYRSYVALETI